MTFPLKWSFCFPCLSSAISISAGFGELSEQQELLEHGNQVVHPGLDKLGEGKAERWKNNE